MTTKKHKWNCGIECEYKQGKVIPKPCSCFKITLDEIERVLISNGVNCVTSTAKDLMKLINRKG